MSCGEWAQSSLTNLQQKQTNLCHQGKCMICRRDLSTSPMWYHLNAALKTIKPKLTVDHMYIQLDECLMVEIMNIGNSLSKLLASNLETSNP